MSAALLAAHVGAELSASEANRIPPLNILPHAFCSEVIPAALKEKLLTADVVIPANVLSVACAVVPNWS